MWLYAAVQVNLKKKLKLKNIFFCFKSNYLCCINVLFSIILFVKKYMKCLNENH